jgi:hypothetical protein
MMVRYRSYDWLKRSGSVPLDRVPRSSSAEDRAEPDEIPSAFARWANFRDEKPNLYYGMQNGVKDRVGFNIFEPVRYPGALVRGLLAGLFQFEPDEALIIVTECRRKRPYWNIQLNDPYSTHWNMCYRLSSSNGHFAKVQFGRVGFARSSR